MSVDILRTHVTKPLEREYESWIVRGIEEYFKALSIAAMVWAVHPAEEKTWSADEALYFPGKLIGLQFKRAELVEKDKPEYSRLRWILGQPRGQFAFVQRHPEIFYVLPTFVNRKWRDEALHHCLFWRPCSCIDYNVWYQNDKAETVYWSVCDSSRWGRFIEQVMMCNVGLKFQDARTCEEYIRGLAAEMDERPPGDHRESGDGLLGERARAPMLYLVYIPLE